jgi:hypothetical protein
MEIKDYELFINNYKQYQKDNCWVFDIEIGQNLIKVIHTIKKEDQNINIYQEFYEKCTTFLMNITKPHEVRSEYHDEGGWRGTLHANNRYDLKPVFLTRYNDEDAIYDFSYFPRSPFYLLRKRNEELFEISFAIYLKLWDRKPEYFQDFVETQILHNFNEDKGAFELFVTYIILKYNSIISDINIQLLLRAISICKINIPEIKVLNSENQRLVKEVERLNEQIVKISKKDDDNHVISSEILQETTISDDKDIIYNLNLKINSLEEKNSLLTYTVSETIRNLTDEKEKNNKGLETARNYEDEIIEKKQIISFLKDENSEQEKLLIELKSKQLKIKDKKRSKVFIRFILDLYKNDKINNSLIAFLVEQYLDPKDLRTLGKEQLDDSDHNATYKDLFAPVKTKPVQSIIDEFEEIADLFKRSGVKYKIDILLSDLN